MNPDPLQLVLVLDVRGEVKEAELRPLLLPQRARYQFLYLSRDGGGPAPGAKDATKDWKRLARGVEQLVRKALLEKKGDQPVELYVAGLAPLPLFTHLGQAVSKFIDTQFVLNRDQAGTLTRYALSAGHSPQVEPFFDVILGLDRKVAASGRVAVFISTIGAPAPEEAMARFLDNHGEALAGLIEVRTQGPGPITAANATQVALELVRTHGLVQNTPRPERASAFSVPAGGLSSARLGPDRFSEIRARRQAARRSSRSSSPSATS